MVAANLAFMLDKGRVSYAVSLLLARASSVKQFGICLLQLAIGGPQVALRDLEDLADGMESLVTWLLRTYCGNATLFCTY